MDLQILFTMRWRETTTWAQINLRLLSLMQTQLLSNKRTRLEAQILLAFNLSSGVLANESFILFLWFRFFDLYINRLDWSQFISPCFPLVYCFENDESISPKVWLVET